MTYRPPADMATLIEQLTSNDWYARMALPANAETLKVRWGQARTRRRAAGWRSATTPLDNAPTRVLCPQVALAVRRDLLELERLRELERHQYEWEDRANWQSKDRERHAQDVQVRRALRWGARREPLPGKARARGASSC